jgi:RHS repeat-associated protein
VDGAGAPIREYAFYPGVDEPHSLRRGSDGAVFYYAQEVPGDVVGLISGGNALVNAYEYRPFGSLEWQSETTPNPLRFQAREIDPTAGLYYFRNRWYDPELARFISEDPIGLEGGINPYAFAGNNPANFTDPFGLQSDKCGQNQETKADPKKNGPQEPCPQYHLEAIKVILRQWLFIHPAGVGLLQQVWTAGPPLRNRPRDLLSRRTRRALWWGWRSWRTCRRESYILRC